MYEIRPHILKQYYEAMYGAGGPLPRAFQEATFEEYYALMQISNPNISRYMAARDAHQPAFRAMTESFEPDPPRPHGQQRDYQRPGIFRRLPALDLREASFEDNIDMLLLDRIKTLTGFERLPRLDQLRWVILVLCGTPQFVSVEPKVSAPDLQLKSCSTSCLNTMLGATSAQKILIEHVDTPVVNLRLLEGHTDLNELRVLVGWVQGTEYLEQLPLQKLFLSNVDMDQRFRKALMAHRGTLRELGLTNEKPFGPDALPELSALRRLEVPGYREFRSEWIDFAVSHPSIRCKFPPVRAPFQKLPKIEVAEIYRGVDILRLQQGKKSQFEVWGHLAGELLESDTLDNHDLKDYLDEAAKKEKKKVKISSSIDELVIQASGIETCKWCIDKILELAK